MRHSSVYSRSRYDWSKEMKGSKRVDAPIKHTHMSGFTSSIPLGLCSCSDCSPTYASTEYRIVVLRRTKRDKGIEDAVNTSRKREREGTFNTRARSSARPALNHHVSSLSVDCSHASRLLGVSRLSSSSSSALLAFLSIPCSLLNPSSFPPFLIPASILYQ